MKYFLGIALCLCSLFIVNEAIADISPSDLPGGVTVLSGVNASIANDRDLRPFDSLARRAFIFGIGESAHGVAGYQSFQFRLSKYLITNFGYRRIMTEILSDDRSLNLYLLTGQGNLTQILYNNPWQGSDKEMFDFFTWIRQWNMNKPSKSVTVYVVDPQSPWLNYPVIENFVQLFDSVSNTKFSQEISPRIRNNCFGASFNNQVEWAYSKESAEYSATGSLPDNKTIECVESINYLNDLFSSEYDRLERAFGSVALGNVFDALRSLRTWQMKSELLYKDGSRSMRTREASFGLTTVWKWQRDNLFSREKNHLDFSQSPSLQRNSPEELSRKWIF